jgi:hypothetical protein
MSHLCVCDYTHFCKWNTSSSSELSIHTSHLDACGLVDLCTSFKRFFIPLLASSILACSLPFELHVCVLGLFILGLGIGVIDVVCLSDHKSVS